LFVPIRRPQGNYSDFVHKLSGVGGGEQ
jgi:hypothetical protein